MLDEAEFEAISRVMSRCIAKVQEFRTEHNSSLRETPIQRLFCPALDEYEALTGHRETNANAIWHHRITLYGPPCPNRGKPLRSPDAAFCAACGEQTVD